MDEELIEVRWHGRGGQGAVMASRIVAKAAFLDGMWSQAFPFFGAERRGAPVMAFTRIAKRPVRLRSQIYEPDVLVLLDPMFLTLEAAWRGVSEKTIVILNSDLDPDNLFLPKRVRKLAVVDATGITLDLGLEVAGLPVPNTAMVGAFVKGTGIISLKSSIEATESLLKRLREKNLEALKRAYERAVVVDSPKYRPEILGE